MSRCYMKTEKPNLEQCELDLRVAEEALSAAQKMPGGPERIAALKRAGQLRFDAYESRLAIGDSTDRKNSNSAEDAHGMPAFRRR
jgi:hypothetical protein